jgi:hypothetical protein
VTRPPYTLEFYEDEHGHEPVVDWLRRLTPGKRRAIGVAIFEILQYEGPQVVGINFGKGLGAGIRVPAGPRRRPGTGAEGEERKAGARGDRQDPLARVLPKR